MLTSLLAAMEAKAMSDKMRWRYGDTNPVVAAVDAGTLIEIGDLLFQDLDDAKPASAAPFQGDLVAGLEWFARRFLGVAMQRSRVGEDMPIRVATTGVFEFDCPEQARELGDYMGPAGHTGLANQRVDLVECAALAIGRVAKRLAVPAGLVLVDIRSTVMTGGVYERTGS